LFFSKALGVEAMGLGDADLMALAGSFPGLAGNGGWLHYWSVRRAFLLASDKSFFRGDNMLPFGPSLAIGTMISCLCWPWIAPRLQALFFHPVMLPLMVFVLIVLMGVSSYILRPCCHLILPSRG